MDNPLTAPCDVCGAPAALTGPNEFHCFSCAQTLALFRASCEHFQLLLERSVDAWRLIWGQLPDIVFNVEDMAPDILADVLKEPHK